MVKQFYLVKKISKKKYLELAEQAGKPEDIRWLNASSAGCMNTKKGEYLAYTDEDELHVAVNEEDYND